LVAVERNGPVRAVPVKGDSFKDLFPHIKRFVDKRAHLMNDQLHSYRKAGKMFAAHDWVNHGDKQFVIGTRKAWRVPLHEQRAFAASSRGVLSVESSRP